MNTRFIVTVLHVAIVLNLSLCNTSSDKLAFIEEPLDVYLTSSHSAVLKCKIQNARSGEFNCNTKLPEDTTSKNIIQIGNKQIFLIELTVTKTQLKDEISLSCTCQGWINSAKNAIISRTAVVKEAFLDEYFEWEPMTTSGLIGKSAEIRCLPPAGDPKPIVRWLKNGVSIDKSNTRVMTSNEGSLLINQVEITDSANYTCVAENLVGVRSSEPALLVVTENKGWTEWSEWSKCNVTCGEGFKKRVRTCLNPPTINNALGCQGFPEQSIACYESCQSNSNNPIPTMLKKEVEILVKDFETSGWSEWSPWSMICNSDCTRSRKRECNSQDLNACRGPDAEIDKCPYDCEPLLISTKKSNNKPAEYDPINHIIPPAIFLTVFLLSVVLLSVALKRQFCAAKPQQIRKDLDHQSIPTNQPIYYSIHPEYSHEHYMDMCTLLPSQPQQHLDTCIFSHTKNNNNLICPAQRHLNAHQSHNYLLYDVSGSNSTTSSKVKLTSSPTNSLEKNNNSSTLQTHTSEEGNSYLPLNNHEVILNFEDSPEDHHISSNVTCQIKRLISEQKLSVRPTKTNSSSVNLSTKSAYDLYAFSIFKSGGLIEISKYSLNTLIPDDIFSGDVNVGLFKSSTQNLLDLATDETLLSPIVVLKTDSFKTFTKPIIISVDHAAQFVTSNWDTAVYYKSLSRNSFERVDEKRMDLLYSHLDGKRCFIMTESDGMYVLVGRPKASNVVCVKEMRYSIFVCDGVLKLIISANTQAAVEAVSEILQSGNCLVIKMPEVFELPFIDTEECLSLETRVSYNNCVSSSSDLMSCSLRMGDLWGSCKEFIEIDLMAVNKTHMSINLSVGLRWQERMVFTYSSLNGIDVSQEMQEFYSCVSVTPVFIPLKITNLLDEYVSRCFRINTLRKTDWSLFSNLIKCDRDAAFFANNKNNSFELCLSLLLMINLTKSQAIENTGSSSIVK